MTDEVQNEAPELPAEQAAPTPNEWMGTDTDESDAAASEAEDQWLDANLESDEGEEAPAEQAEAEPVEAPAEPDAPAADNTELADAYTALRRAGLEMEDIEALPEERVIAIAAKQNKIQSDLDRRFREGATPEDGDATESPKDSAATPEAAEATADSPFDLSSMASPLAEALALDDEGTKLLVDFQQQAMSPLLQTIKSQEDLIQQTQMSLMGMQEDMAVDQLRERFPQLADTNSMTRVRERMGTLVSSGNYNDMMSLLEDAASIEFAKQTTDEVKAARDKLGQLRSNGQPVPATGPAPAAQTTYTSEDLEDMVLEALDSGDQAALRRAQSLSSR
jgi:hypothetical protein